MKLKGWTHLWGSVYENDRGTRVHQFGLCRLLGGQIIRGTTYPESRNLDRFVRMCGGNKKRGTLAWAQSLEERA